MGPLGFAGLGGLAGATGSMAGDIFGVLDQPRKWLWRNVPGLHDPDSGEAYTGDELAGRLMDNPPGGPGEGESLLPGIGQRLLGVGLQTALDPLTFLAGPLGGLVGGKAAQTLGTVRMANRTAEQLDAVNALMRASEAAAGAAKNVPDFSTIATAAGKQVPADVVREALVAGNPAKLRGYGGMGALGSTIKRPPSQFLVDQLERQGFGASVMDPAGGVTDKFLLSNDPSARQLFAPRGGRLMQLADVDPAARGPLWAAINPEAAAAASVPPPLSSVVPHEVLDPLSRNNPILAAMMREPGMDYQSFLKMPADKAADILDQAAGHTMHGVMGVRDSLRESPWTRVFARYLTKNPLGV